MMVKMVKCRYRSCWLWKQEVGTTIILDSFVIMVVQLFDPRICSWPSDPVLPGLGVVCSQGKARTRRLLPHVKSVPVIQYYFNILLIPVCFLSNILCKVVIGK